MQMPSTPWSIMQSRTRRWPSRSISPLSRNGVGATGMMPRYGVEAEAGMEQVSGAKGSMVVAGHGGAALADEEVEIGALVRLQHVLDVELHVAAIRVRGRRRPSGAAAGELGILDMKMQ